MTKTIEEVKAAKQELEANISQMVNEFAEDYDVRVGLSLTNINGICQPAWYVFETEIRL